MLGATLKAGVALTLALFWSTAPSLGQSTDAPILNEVFTSVKDGESPPDWFVSTTGWTAVAAPDGPEDRSRTVVFKPAESNAPGLGIWMRKLSAVDARAKKVELVARIRVEGAGHGQMWLRVDRVGGLMGALDNMRDRPIRAGEWTDARIALDVDADAESFALGFMSFGGSTLRVQSVVLRVTGPARAVQAPSPATELSPRGLENLQAAVRVYSYARFFHPSDAAVEMKDWDRFAVDLIERTEPAKDATDLALRLRESLSGFAPGLEVWAGAPESAPPVEPMPAGATKLVRWVHRGVGRLSTSKSSVYASRVQKTSITKAGKSGEGEQQPVIAALPGGVSVRLPIRLPADTEGTLPRSTPYSAPPDAPVLRAHHRSTRLAGVCILWGVMQHFYPYFDVVECDWDAALRDALIEASKADGEEQHLGVLRRLLARLHDGHGNVWGPGEKKGANLPIACAWAGTELVVVGRDSSVAGEVNVGDVLVGIDGVSMEQRYRAAAATLCAATDAWSRRISPNRMFAEAGTARCTLELRHPDGAGTKVEVLPSDRFYVTEDAERRPKSGTELDPGIVYMNLVGAEDDALVAVLDELERAKGIVFDLRGYPASAARTVLGHLSSETLQSARFEIPIIEQPDRKGWTWGDPGRWKLPPLEPRLKARVAWLTDSSAISYAESIMGIVEAYRLGEIVGSPTAGTNGNVNPFELPGGYRVSWTGMRVRKHDGSRHHGVGIAPTIPCVPTAKGIAEGRDEVLEKAVEVLREQIGR